MIKSGFFNPKNGDRKYTADDLNNILEGIVTDGVVPKIGSEFEVSVSGEKVIVGTGKAIVSNTWTRNTAPFEISIPLAESNSRYDLVCIRIDKDARENTMELIQGVESETPERPIFEANETVSYFPLAYLLVAASKIEVEDARIFASSALGAAESESSSSTNAVIETGVVTSDGPVKAGEPVSFWNGNVRAHGEYPFQSISTPSDTGNISRLLTVHNDDGSDIAVCARLISSSSPQIRVYWAYFLNGDMQRQDYMTYSFVPSGESAESSYDDIQMALCYTDNLRAYFIIALRGATSAYVGNFSCGRSNSFLPNQSGIRKLATTNTISSSTPHVQAGSFNKDGLTWVAVMQYASSSFSYYFYVLDKDGATLDNTYISARNMRFAATNTGCVLYMGQYYTNSSSYDKNMVCGSIHTEKDTSGKYRILHQHEDFRNGLISSTETAYFAFPISDTAINFFTTTANDGYMITLYANRSYFYSSYGFSLNHFSGYKRTPLTNQTVNTGVSPYEVTNEIDESSYRRIVLLDQNSDEPGYSLTTLNDGLPWYNGLNYLYPFYTQPSYSTRSHVSAYLNGSLVFYGNCRLHTDSKWKIGWHWGKINLDNAIALEDGNPGDSITVAKSGRVHFDHPVTTCTSGGVKLVKLADNEYEVILE